MRILTSTHWGNYLVEKEGVGLKAIHPARDDRDPSPIGRSLMDSQRQGCRVARPSIRLGFLQGEQRCGGKRRGADAFVEVPWDEALDIAADAIQRTINEYGNEAVFGGSYGWGSAGRFHHAQSQLHRFLNHAGGYTYSVQSYSTGTAQIILPHVLGIPALELMSQAPTIDDVIEHTKLIVSFGGISMKNTQINQGGIGDHTARAQLQRCSAAGVDVVCISPVRDDIADFMGAKWWPVRPNSDVALMLGIAFVLHDEGLLDEDFLATHCVGYEAFARYLTGELDGQPKNCKWASQLCDIDADEIAALARRMASEPCLLSISWSLQRTEHGDQPYWMIAVLAAMLGNVGLPGQGVGYGYGCIHNFGFAGRRRLPFKVGELPQGKNAVKSFIPVARVADMLLHPGERFPFNGQTLTYPDIKLVYWAGGNPFHHHQDLNRLRDAWDKPQTVIVNEPFWTATARHADIVFPTTTALEREDFAWGRDELTATPMHQALEPFAQSQNDYDVFSGLAKRLGFAATFTQGRNASKWIEELWRVTTQRAAEAGVTLPAFNEFWRGGVHKIEASSIEASKFALEAFRHDPHGSPLHTPSGKIEIYSERLACFALPDCAGYPRWQDKEEFIGSDRSAHYPLALNSNQPVTRLHSQYDFGVVSREAKVREREVMTMHPRDAASRGINSGDIVRVFNDRGACLAAAALSDAVRAGVVVLPTGAWFDPLDPREATSLEVHGNPNVLTRDIGTSSLAQGTSAHSCLVQVERFAGPLPNIKVFSQPPMVSRDERNPS